MSDCIELVINNDTSVLSIDNCKFSNSALNGWDVEFNNCKFLNNYGFVGLFIVIVIHIVKLE